MTVSVTINPGKETKEVIDVLVKTVRLIKEAVKTKDKNAIISNSVAILGDIYTAVEGADQIDDELKGKNLDDSLAYLIKTLGGELIPSAAGDVADDEL